MVDDALPSPVSSSVETCSFSLEVRRRMQCYKITSTPVGPPSSWSIFLQLYAVHPPGVQVAVQQSDGQLLSHILSRKLYVENKNLGAGLQRSWQGGDLRCRRLSSEYLTVQW